MSDEFDEHENPRPRRRKRAAPPEDVSQDQPDYLDYSGQEPETPSKPSRRRRKAVEPDEAIPAEGQPSRPRRPAKTAKPSGDQETPPGRQRREGAKPKAADKKKKKPAKPMDRGKWSGGTFRQRLQRILWIFHILYLYAPAWLAIAILVVIFGPIVARNLRKPTAIAPLYTREVQHWAPQIARWSAQYDVDPNLIATLMQIESCGYPGAASSVGAQGLFQVMPMHFEENEPMTDPETNAERGIQVIRDCLRYANGDVGLALACYNGGPSLISRDPETWPEETKRYYIWGVGIYNDAVQGKETSPSLGNWLQAGGETLSKKAAETLGLATIPPEFLPPKPSAIPPTQTPVLPTAELRLPQNQPTAFSTISPSGKLPTFALPGVASPTPPVKIFLTPGAQ